MSVDLLIFPFLCITLFFEAFLLVTFLSAPARQGRARPATTNTPNVAMIVPCYNEESTVAGTIESLLALDYPREHLQIILVDDGSTDGTPAVMDTFANQPQITVIHKENGGKHSALNAGIAAATQAEFVGCLDADSFVAPGSLKEILSCFDNPKVAAATPAMSIHNPKTILEHMQNAEYIYGITLRHTISSLNGLYVTPGPFSLYRRSVILALGGFQYGHQTEDLEMALRIQRAGYIIDNAPRARVYTKGPKSVLKLITQRTRWTTGFLRNVLLDYRDFIGNPRLGTLGMVVLPLGLFAVASGIILFVIIFVETIYNLSQTYFVTHGVPLSYVFRIHQFEWFSIPVTAVLLLTLVVTGTVLVLMRIGKNISETPGSLITGMLAYLFLYALIAPFWLMRAVRDVTFGTRRKWK